MVSRAHGSYAIIAILSVSLIITIVMLFTTTDSDYDDSGEGAASALIESSVSLSADEVIIDAYFNELADADIQSGVFMPRGVFGTDTFLRMASTELHQMMDSMPKGAMLHCHRGACFNYSEVVLQIAANNAQYGIDYGTMVYVYADSNNATERDGKISMAADALCPNEAAEYGATLIEDMDLDALLQFWSFDEFSEAELLTMTDDEIWQEFELRFDMPKYAFRWEPVTRELIIPSLLAEAERHGLSYLEPTGSLGKAYTKTCNADGDVEIYETLSKVKAVAQWDAAAALSPVSMNLVCSSFRGAGDMMAEMTGCMEAWQDTAANEHVRVVAWDVVGQEDKYGLSRDFLEVWQAAEDAGFPVVPHTGETIHPDGGPTPFLETSPSNNLRVHLGYANTKRIGHGIALSNMEAAFQSQWVEAGIPVVVCPVSNVILGYIRGHTFSQACEFSAMGFKVSLSHDDAPVFSKHHSITHDFEVTYRSCHLCGNGLHLMKTLASNSWDASLLRAEELEAKRNAWSIAWDEWAAELAVEICAKKHPPSACTTGLGPQDLAECAE